MNFSKRISTNANTTKANADETEIKLIDGIISKVQIFLPEGHVGLSHCQILDGEIQIFPTNLGEDYSGASLDFDTSYRIVKPWALKIKTWNDDDTHPHDFIVRITLKTVEPLSKQMIVEKRKDGFLDDLINFVRSIFK